MERNGTDIPFWEDDNNYALSLFELGGRFSFRDVNKKFRPYADVALTSTAAVFDNEPETSAKGGAISLGGGAQYFLSNVFALDASLMLSPGNFSDIVFANYSADVGDDGGFFATRFSLGTHRLSLPIIVKPLSEAALLLPTHFRPQSAALPP